MQCEFRWLTARAFGGGSRLDTVVVEVAKLNVVDESDDTNHECYAIGNLHGVGCAGGSNVRAVVVGSAVPICRSSTRTCVQINENEASRPENWRQNLLSSRRHKETPITLMHK